MVKNIGIENMEKLNDLSVLNIQKELSNKLNNHEDIAIINEKGETIYFYDNSKNPDSAMMFKMLKLADEERINYFPKEFFPSERVHPLTSEIISVLSNYVSQTKENIYLI